MSDATETIRYDARLEIEAGHVALQMAGGAVSRLEILDRQPALRPHPAPGATAVLQRVVDHLLRGRDISGLDVRLEGTLFQCSVWGLLRTIPRGKTRTYGDIARELGSSARAVGGACRANRVLLLVPCHRVVASRGAGGFAGHRQGRWPSIKRWLLTVEGATAA